MPTCSSTCWFNFFPLTKILFANVFLLYFVQWQKNDNSNNDKTGGGVVKGCEWLKPGSYFLQVFCSKRIWRHISVLLQMFWQNSSLLFAANLWSNLHRFTYAGNMNQALRSVGFKMLSSPLESTFFWGGWRYLIQQSLMIMIICLFWFLYRNKCWRGGCSYCTLHLIIGYH